MPGTFATPSERIPVAVLGATGAVGQTFLRLLDAHPWFRVAQLAASERSEGKRYSEAARGIVASIPSWVSDMTLLPCVPDAIDAPLVFSALDADAATEIEPEFARAGRIVLSNARSYRMEPDVPLLIPEVNPDHLVLLSTQRASRGWDGAIVTNANCATIVIAMALAPLHEAFGVRQLAVVTMQAVSGAGYPGVPSLDILGNVIPHIANEEEKIESETRKILGRVEGTTVASAEMRISAHANRVPVVHGHIACMSIGFAERVRCDDARCALEAWRGHIFEEGLPSAPARPLVVSVAADRPQPRRDVDAGNGMSVTVGRVRSDPLFDLRMVAMGHNTVRGAAGASILNAELLVARGIAGAPW